MRATVSECPVLPAWRFVPFRAPHILIGLFHVTALHARKTLWQVALAKSHVSLLPSCIVAVVQAQRIFSTSATCSSIDSLRASFSSVVVGCAEEVIATWDSAAGRTRNRCARSSRARAQQWTGHPPCPRAPWEAPSPALLPRAPGGASDVGSREHRRLGRRTCLVTLVLPPALAPADYLSLTRALGCWVTGSSYCVECLHCGQHTTALPEFISKRRRVRTAFFART